MLTRPVLLWDGGCGFCARWVEWIRRRDPAGAIELLRASERGTYPALTAIPGEALDHAMHLALPDGRVLAGARAIPEILRHLPAWRRLTWLFLVPGVPWIADRAYRYVAARRHRWGCMVKREGRSEK